MKKIRVVVVDDSAFSRRTITDMLEGIENIEVVGYASNGEEGMKMVIGLKPDLVTLDLEMPKMDGFTFLRILAAAHFSIPVIVVSALSESDKVFKALELGALDFVAKPSSNASRELLGIRNDLQNKVLQVLNLGNRALRPKPHPINMLQTYQSDSLHKCRPGASAKKMALIAIGSSTGGPPALQHIFSSFKKNHHFAVVVAQHMPAGFTRAFAERLNSLIQFDIKEAEDGDALLPCRILIAPGGMNMILETDGNKVIARIRTPTASDRYIPSVDVLLESCAPIFKSRMIGVILTGMGNDGSKGVLAVKQHGGYLIAESEETAVVYGMPREAVATGLVDQVAPLHEIAQKILVKSEYS
jgi:two-component system chemotaxis response regulator CheB